jgi:hypothetical protein
MLMMINGVNYYNKEKSVTILTTSSNYSDSTLEAINREDLIN